MDAATERPAAEAMRARREHLERLNTPVRPPFSIDCGVCGQSIDGTHDPEIADEYLSEAIDAAVSWGRAVEWPPSDADPGAPVTRWRHAHCAIPAGHVDPGADTEPVADPSAYAALAAWYGDARDKIRTPTGADHCIPCAVCRAPIVSASAEDERDEDDQLADGMAAAVLYGRAVEWPYEVATAARRWRHAHCRVPDRADEAPGAA